MTDLCYLGESRADEKIADSQCRNSVAGCLGIAPTDGSQEGNMGLAFCAGAACVSMWS
jgi:hypothetical protein